MNAESQISVSGSQYLFNGNTTYKSSYGMGKGRYIFRNVPSSHPIAIIPSSLHPFNIPPTIVGADLNAYDPHYNSGATQVWRNLYADVNNSQYGCSVSMNSDCTVIAIGQRERNIGNYPGRVFVYKIDQSGNWINTGDSTYGLYYGSYSRNKSMRGMSVSLNSKGNLLAVGCHYHYQNWKGRVEVYRSINDVPGEFGTLSYQLENLLTPRNLFYINFIDLYRNEARGNGGFYFGYKVHFNGDGTKLAVSAIGEQNYVGLHNVNTDHMSTGSVRVYNIDASGGEQLTKDYLEYPPTGIDLELGVLPSDVTAPTYDWDFRQASTTSITDSIGGLTATYYGGMSSTVANGASADGSNDYIQLQSFEFGGTFSIEIYFQYSANPPSWTRVFETANSGTSDNTTFNLTEYINNSYLAVQSFGTTHDVNTLVTSATIITNVWRHMVITMNNQTLKVYQDGSLINTDTTNSQTVGIRDTFYLFTNTPNGTKMQGNIKFFRYWHGTELSAANALSLYQRSTNIFAGKVSGERYGNGIYTFDVNNMGQGYAALSNGWKLNNGVTYNNGKLWVFNKQFPSDGYQTGYQYDYQGVHLKRYYGTLQSMNPSAISGSRVLGTIGLPENIYLYKIIVRGYDGGNTYNVRDFTIEGSLDNSTFFSISGSVVFDTILYRAIWTTLVLQVHK